jgi:peptidoglycan/LPS O-acetylase OafA/YrhL
MFYLGFPFVCRLARSERNMVVLLVALVIAGPIARVVGPHDSNPQDQTYLCCMDGIALGCLAALLAWRVHLRPFALRAIFTLGLAAAIFVDVFRKQVFDSGLVSTGLYVTVLEVGIALMLIGIQSGLGAGRLARGTGLLRVFGRNSYEIYLTHSFVVVFLTQLYRAYYHGGALIPVWYLAILAISAALGYLFARFYSNPLNQLLRARGYYHSDF